MEVEKKSNISFGTTLDREIFPVKVPPTRFGNDLSPMRGAPQRGPGCYDNEEVSNFLYQVKTKITSEKGYSLGARTGPRFGPKLEFITPAPDRYQTACTDPMLFDPAYKPFSVAAKRFPVFKRDVEEISPGPGTYEHGISGSRKVGWHNSFGGTPINLPSVKQHSTIDKNTEKPRPYRKLLTYKEAAARGEKLLSTKEEKKYHRRLAYLKLYYD